ncbi:MAG: PIN domain nuclease [Endomicrobiia bacterium]|nr:PIN domain nuclease [Endomicrobiia bacterium]
MLIWSLRLFAVVGGGTIGYFQVARNIRGALVGVAIAAAVVILEYLVEKIALDTLIAAIVGAILGLIGAKLLDYTVFLIENQKLYEIMNDYSLLIKFAFAYLGVTLAVMKKNELDLLDRDILKKTKKTGAMIYLLDTSSVIDGRIADVIATNFLTGVLGVPKFILEELQTLADSSDSMKRTRARRGLNIIAQIQKEALIAVKIIDKDAPQAREVDLKLIQLAKDLEARIITTDFNLNKIATLQGIVVLNINDLSNALKPVHLPGEKMQIYVAKEGKEREQGIGFLDDGTMVVVEEGRRLLGRRVECAVISLLQTSSGRMIFVKPSEN